MALLLALLGPSRETRAAARPARARDTHMLEVKSWFDSGVRLSAAAAASAPSPEGPKGRVVPATTRHLSDKIALTGARPEGCAVQYLGVFTKSVLGSHHGVDVYGGSTNPYRRYGCYEKVGDPTKMLWYDGEAWVVGDNLGGRIGMVCVDERSTRTTDWGRRTGVIVVDEQARALSPKPALRSGAPPADAERRRRPRESEQRRRPVVETKFSAARAATQFSESLYGGAPAEAPSVGYEPPEGAEPQGEAEQRRTRVESRPWRSRTAESPFGGPPPEAAKSFAPGSWTAQSSPSPVSGAPTASIGPFSSAEWRVPPPMGGYEFVMAPEGLGGVGMGGGGGGGGMGGSMGGGMGGGMGGSMGGSEAPPQPTGPGGAMQKEMQRAQLEDRVAKARAASEAQVEARVAEILQPALDEWATSAIDTAELERRKAAAPEQAKEERERRVGPLDAAHDAFKEAAAAREEAWEAFASAFVAEQTAESELLRSLEAVEAAGQPTNWQPTWPVHHGQSPGYGAPLGPGGLGMPPQGMGMPPQGGMGMPPQGAFQQQQGQGQQTQGQRQQGFDPQDFPQMPPPGFGMGFGAPGFGLGAPTFGMMAYGPSPPQGTAEQTPKEGAGGGGREPPGEDA